MIANNLDVWAEAADRQLLKINKDNSQTKDANEVNKNAISIPKHLNYELGESSLSSMSSEDNTKQRNIEHSVIVNLAKESGPLGIHVVPDNDDIGCANGLIIQGIEPSGRIDRDGRLHVGDSIIEINGHSIRNVDFERAQEIFRNALQSEEITLRLIKYDNHNQTHNTSVKKPFPPPVLPKPANIMKQHEQLRLEAGMVEGEERVQHAKTATVTPTKKLTAPVNHKPTASTALVVANTRKIGKKYHIQLKKGSEGLGFSITTRDNPAGGNCPIYIKTILPSGAAVEDGRLRTGDRLLEVCGIEMTGKSQTEAVSILRNLLLGTTVDLIVSRQEVDLSPSPMMPRQLPPDKSGETNSSSWNEREVLTFEIPLNDTGSAGLGVSVKGKTSTSSGQHSDLGIFVKSVIHGGAASKDGRLKTNDQLININGIPLLGMTNSQAMETLRRAMIQSEGPIANPNAITLTVARRVPHQFNSCHQRNDSLLSATSNDSCNEENLSPTNDMFTNRFDETCDSYRSNENTVIYRPKSDSVNKDPQNLVPTPQNPVINHSSSNTTFLKKFYLSENQDSNTIYEKSSLPRNDVIIEQDIIDANSNDHCISSNANENPESAPRDSQLSLTDENADGFRRDGFGRQSMSEKRHTQLDAKNTDTYRRNKKAKEGKDKQQKDKPDSKDQSLTETQDSQTHILPHESGMTLALYFILDFQ
jgi:partitioning defective protein 3